MENTCRYINSAYLGIFFVLQMKILESALHSLENYRQKHKDLSINQPR
jgi:hypothetical protein